MAAPSASRLRPADAPSTVNVPVDREIPYVGLVPSEAAAAGHTGPVKGCSAPDGQGRAKGIDCIEIEKPSSAVVKAAGCIEKPSSGADVTRDAVLIPLGNGLWQIPDEEVQWVLSRRREHIRPDLFGPDCVEDVNAVRDEFFEYQAWMRAKYDADDGCVIVDDKFVAEREEHLQWMSEWTERMADRLGCLDLGDMDFSDRLSDFYDDSEDEAVEVQELDTN